MRDHSCNPDSSQQGCAELHPCRAPGGGRAAPARSSAFIHAEAGEHGGCCGSPTSQSIPQSASAVRREQLKRRLFCRGLSLKLWIAARQQKKRNAVCEKGDQKREGPQSSGRQKSKPAELQWQQIYLEMPLLKVGVAFALVLKTKVEVDRRTSNKNRSELIFMLM